jgi:hypothetical protein
LNDPGTPPELEALVTRKFTCYYQYKQLHKKLFSATNDECTEVAAELIDAYIENRVIYDELEYYRVSGKVLGKHPIFRQFTRNKEINSMSAKELCHEQKKLINNIWRVNNEMKKEDKPHLYAARKVKLEQYERDLALINKLLND